ncbi:MAG TPA: glycoside hydrolase domain-containing protein [Bryobacteraceae bacterium]|nr:glycoside hydrolase domain-containing protein [Bryobacteraceae bacterium]HZW96344.1 glycoside hydrolase domain-containing protein [Candidatus Eremiobacteraceae bacterium]
MGFKLFILATMGVAFMRTAGEVAQPFTWWITHPLAKIKPLDPVPSAPAKSVDLYAGRNEFESFQIVLRAGSTDLSGVDIDFSDFRTSHGAEISKENVTVYLERFLNLRRPSMFDGGTGLWPDPLVPRVDRYAHEKRNAFPFTVQVGRNQPMWVEIFVPPATNPGNYTGSARISISGAVKVLVPIHVVVWNFTLPSTSTLKSSFGFSGLAALKQHRGQYTSDEDLYAITRLYEKAALLHRISICGGSMVPPKYSYDSGRMRLHWSTYDAEVGAFLDGVAISEGDPLHGARATSVEIRTPPALDTEEQQTLYWTQYAKHFQQKGWLDRLFLYLWDEPAPAVFPDVLKRGRVALRVNPKIRSLVTVPFTEKLAEVVQIWVPLVNCIEPKPGYDDFCEHTPPFETYTRQTDRSSLWFYQSCASHGCNVVGGPYFTGWPSYMIDAPGVSNRVMEWIAWKYRIEGELYYSMDEAYGRGKDPWDSVFLVGGNGDGTLFYPGRPDHISGHTDIPIESIRLKLIREGMQDYEYLSLLAKLGGAKCADEYADRIVKKPYLWESQPETFLNVRQELGEALDRLAARSGKEI